MAEKSVLLVLHDVAPCSWEHYAPFVTAVDELTGVNITWLVVPDFHRRNPLSEARWFQQRLHDRLVRGDELALHGYYHCDDGPTPRTLHDWFMRRIYTWEGEFYSLDQQQALTRLEAGIEVFKRNDWPLYGFVAPAWLMSQGTKAALRQLPLNYTSDARHLFWLPDFKEIQAPGLVWSAGTAWRRVASRIYSECTEIRLRKAPVIRLGLHPVDMLHESSRRYWLDALKRLLEDGRQPMTKIAWLNAQASVSSSVTCSSARG